jgi:hypothetical protein
MQSVIEYLICISVSVYVAFLPLFLFDVFLILWFTVKDRFKIALVSMYYGLQVVKAGTYFFR